MSNTGYFESFERQKLDPRDGSGFKTAMIDFCRSNRMAADALLAGNVELLGLENLKESFGEDWIKVRGKVHLLVETIIRKVITPHDVYVLANAEQFIVLFGRDDRKTAAVKTRHIAAEVNRRLYGSDAEAGIEGIVVQSMVLEVPRDAPENLAGVAELTHAVEEARQEQQEEETRAFEAVKEEARLRFWPVTNIRKRLVSMYRVELALPGGALQEQTGEDDSDGGREDTGALGCAMDIATLQQVLSVLGAEPRAKPFLLVPVHMRSVIEKRFRMALLNEFRALPEWSGQRLFVYMQDIDDDVPQAVLHSNFAYLSPFCAGFVGGFSRTFKRAERLRGAGLKGVSCTATDTAAGAGEVTPGLIMELGGFVSSNGRAGGKAGNGGGREGDRREGSGGKGIRTFLFGAPDPEIATAARRVRYDYIDGPGVAPSLGSFGPVFRVS